MMHNDVDEFLDIEIDDSGVCAQYDGITPSNIGTCESEENQVLSALSHGSVGTQQQQQPSLLEAPIQEPQQFNTQEALLIANLHSQFMQFAQFITARMEKIEDNVSKIWDVVGTEFQTCSSSGGDSSNPNCDNPSSALVASTESGFALQIGDMEQRGYIKTPFPDWEITLVNLATNQLVTDEGYRVSLRLMSGHNTVVEHCVANHHTLTFPLVGGRACVSGLKFLVVSSNHGDSYYFEVSVTTKPEAAGEITTVSTPRFQIFSERLKHETKARTVLDLTPTDHLFRVPGIGKKYASKLAEQGFHTVSDLARIDNSPKGRAARLDLLNAVRRDRGALTEAKLAELIRGAQLVISDATGQQRSSDSMAMPAVVGHKRPASDSMASAMPAAKQPRLSNKNDSNNGPNIVCPEEQALLDLAMVNKLQSLPHVDSPISHDAEADGMFNSAGMLDLSEFC